MAHVFNAKRLLPRDIQDARHPVYAKPPCPLSGVGSGSGFALGAGRPGCQTGRCSAMHRSTGQWRAHSRLGLPAAQAGTHTKCGRPPQSSPGRTLDAQTGQPVAAIQPGRHAATHGRCVRAFGGATAPSALSRVQCRPSAAGTMPSVGSGGSSDTGSERGCPACCSSTALALIAANTVDGPKRWPGA